MAQPRQQQEHGLANPATDKVSWELEVKVDYVMLAIIWSVMFVFGLRSAIGWLTCSHVNPVVQFQAEVGSTTCNPDGERKARCSSPVQCEVARVVDVEKVWIRDIRPTRKKHPWLGKKDYL